ncbi:TRZ/ATZ family hydrolase [Bacteriovoracales bacterium]|nr:TRZ/ATZ family hydrolase [Bacteriovoracales bacterium]
MKKVDLILQPKGLVQTVDNKPTLETGKALIILEGKIEDITSLDEAKKKYDSKEIIYLNDHVLIPGLINTHNHMSMSLMRGIADDIPLMDWLNNHIWPTEMKFVGPKFVEDGALLAIGEMFLTGTTTCSDMYFFPETTAKALEKAGMRGQLVTPILDFPTTYAQDGDGYLEKAEIFAKKYSGNPLVNIGLGPHAPYTVGDETFKKLVKLNEKMNLPIQIHLHETKGECDDSLKSFGVRPMERLNQLGLFSWKVQCVHMTQMNDEEIDLAIKKDLSVVHCPESNMKLASGICPVPKLLKKGINVGIGTDGAASNNDLNLLGEMKTAGLLGKVDTLDPTACNAEEIFHMATLGGAKVLGLQDRVGELAVGKMADIVAIKEEGFIDSFPNFNFLSNLIYAQSSQRVDSVWVSGKRVVKDGELVTLNKDELLERTKIWQEKLSQSS